MKILMAKAVGGSLEVNLPETSKTMVPISIRINSNVSLRGGRSAVKKGQNYVRVVIEMTPHMTLDLFSFVSTTPTPWLKQILFT